MKIFGQKVTPLFVSVAAAVTVTAIICIATLSCSINTLTFETTFYFVCYKIEDNAVSAGSVADAVSSYGGAGYILEYKGKYYVTVSCYYEQNDAENVCARLKKRELDCDVLEVSTQTYPLSSPSKKQLYLGNLNTLQSLSVLAYDCANKLDTGAYGQNQAKSVIADIHSGIRGLAGANADNPFLAFLRPIDTVCTELASGFTYSKDLRKLQIAIADAIINVRC